MAGPAATSRWRQSVRHRIPPAALYQLWSLMAEGQHLLLFLDVVVVVGAMFVVLEAVAALSREHRAHIHGDGPHGELIGGSSPFTLQRRR